jgi:hypothetical protein
MKSHQTGDKHQHRDRPMRLHCQTKRIRQAISGAPKQHPQAYQGNETQQRQRQPEDCCAIPRRDGAGQRGLARNDPGQACYIDTETSGGGSAEPDTIRIRSDAG